MREYLYLSQGGDAYIVQDDSNDSLTALQTLVGGLIQGVYPTKLGPEVDTWVNEEGLMIEGFGINLVASFITGRQLVGPCVIAGHTRGGETISVPKKVVTKLKREGLMIDERTWAPFEIANRCFPTTLYSEVCE